MAYDLKSEDEVKEYVNNLGIEYRFGCYSEKKPEACHLLGDYLEAIKKDFSKAAKVYKYNCDDYNYGKSCLKYARFLLLGKGGVKEDFKDGYNYLEKACNQNEAEACFHQGLMIINASDKVNQPRDVLKGMALLEKACLGKNANSCYYLSGMYIKGVKKPNSDDKKGDYEVPINMKSAHKFALEGCNLGNVYCCANLSQMYSKGDGVEKNEELAEKYKKLSLEIQSQMLETNKTLTFQQGIK